MRFSFFMKTNKVEVAVFQAHRYTLFIVILDEMITETCKKRIILFFLLPVSFENRRS